MTQEIVLRVRTLVSAKVGKCAKCMRWSLRGAVLGWVALGLVWLAAPRWAPFVLVWPLSFTTLWIIHIVTFGRRVVRNVIEKNDKENGPAIPGRRVLLRFLSASAVAAAVSAALPRLLRADDSGCPSGMHVCSDDTHCCPQSATYDCLADDCDSSKSHTCYVGTDDDLKYLQQCCSQLIRC